MNIVVWILGGITGWLTGKAIGEKGYGTLVLGGYARILDVFFGVVAASISGYLFFWAVREGISLGTYGTAVLGSVTLVGTCRLISGRYFRPPSYKGMSRAAFVEWHDSLAMKELASWKPPPRRGPTTPAENRRP